MTSSPCVQSRLLADSTEPFPEHWQSFDGLVAGFGDRAHGPPRHALLLRTQVHGTRIVDAAWCRGDAVVEAGDGLARVQEDGDALIARQPGVVVAVRTADCVPLLLVAPRARWSAAVHAGWRGTAAGIATAAVQAALAAGVRPDELHAALGPSIGPCCYEVSDELAVSFANAGLPVRPPPSGRPKPHLDLRAANRLLLERSGVDPDRIVSVGPCTRCACDRFHSHRASPQSAGRQVSWVGWEDRRP